MVADQHAVGHHFCDITVCSHSFVFQEVIFPRLALLLLICTTVSVTRSRESTVLRPTRDKAQDELLLPHGSGDSLLQRPLIEHGHGCESARAEIGEVWRSSVGAMMGKLGEIQGGPGARATLGEALVGHLIGATSPVILT